MFNVYSKYAVQSFPTANYIKSFELHNTEKKQLKISGFLRKLAGDVSEFSSAQNELKRSMAP